MSHAGIVHPVVPALCYVLPQIRQPNVGTVALNQSLLPILARASAFGGRRVARCRREIRGVAINQSLEPLGTSQDFRR
jgi:hypothetical protein